MTKDIEEARRFALEQAVKFHASLAPMRPAESKAVTETAAAFEAFLTRPEDPTEG